MQWLIEVIDHMISVCKLLPGTDRYNVVTKNVHQEIPLSAA